MKQSKNLNDLIDALTILPGVGRKSAQRMAYQLIRSNNDLTLNLADKLNNITSNIASCKVCGIYLDIEDVDKQVNGECHICIAQNKDPSKICVTESPSDAYIIDQSTDYNGYFFVLDGSLSPLDGRGPIEVGIKRLQQNLEEKKITELILATSTTVEGEATAHYVQQLASKMSIKVSRIAFGIPLNGELGYLDSETISHAFNERKII
ncbi:MAG: recombination mediator RecR [Pseudomonadota bacterium]|nr:recombination mediator RecR [Pseudomonadota bacterium]MED5430079.1 recombination mediator RecR [Pseudomonadota bacterium]|tara:strand:- start:9599 stop:10219 length:621 start_codon:yes stop_codon:yes gene_type:complete